MSEDERKVETVRVSDRLQLERLNERLERLNERPEKLPQVCTFPGSRRAVMEGVWKRMRELEAKGVAVPHAAFGRLIKSEWAKVREEAQRVCPVLSPQELERLLA